MKTTTGCWKATLLLILFVISGCVAVVDPPGREVVVAEPDRHGPPPWAPAHGWRRQHETYYYYPVIQVYYYPAGRKYYWLENGQWRIDVRLPSRYVIEEHRSVVVDLDDEPHKYHDEIRAQYPPNYFERGRGKGRGRES